MNTLDVVAAIGLALGGIFGISGSVVSDPALRQIFWAIDGTGIVVATSLLTIRFYRRGSDAVAAGFLVFTVAEGLLLSGIAAGLEGSRPSFAGGVVLWAAALMMISVPREFPAWTRYIGMIASVLFVITAMRIFAGEPLGPISQPLPFFAYPFLVLTFVGWIAALRR